MDVLIIILASIIAAIAAQLIAFGRYGSERLSYSSAFNVTETRQGEEIEFVETIRNGKSLPVPWIKVNIFTSRHLDFALSNSSVAQDSRFITSAFFLKGHQRVRRHWRVTPTKRGVYRIPEVTMTTGDLMGISRSSVGVKVDSTLTVYPETVTLDRDMLRVGRVVGERSIARFLPHNPYLVSGAREYDGSEAMNRISWKATARMGTLMSKVNDVTASMGLAIVLNVQTRDYLRSEIPDKELVEDGIKVASTLANIALADETAVRLLSNAPMPGEGPAKAVEVPEGSGKAHVMAIQDILAGLEVSVAEDFDDLWVRLCEPLRDTIIVLISCYLPKALTSGPQAYRQPRGASPVRFVSLGFPDRKGLPDWLECHYYSPSSKSTARVHGEGGEGAARGRPGLG
ncbi:MAG: DUF58 domain-containing protein [Oscillospiraceae bacterium]|nr:DUF58 domain-containing protein [Oscillospiraceae bacterium]